MTKSIQISKAIVVKATVVLGGVISTYQWKLDDILQPNNTDIFIIPPNTLSPGNHTIKFRGQNYCGGSSELIEIINITEVNNMQQTDPININLTPTISYTIYLRRKSDVTLTVLDDLNGSNPNAPVVGATVDINTTPTLTSGTTDAAGNVVFTGVPLGTYTVTITFT